MMKSVKRLGGELAHLFKLLAHLTENEKQGMVIRHTIELKLFAYNGFV